MFNKLKQIKDLRDQAKTMQNALAQESVTKEKNGCRLTMDGNMAITSLTLNPELSDEKKAETIKSLVNDSVKQVQQIMAKKLQAMGGLDKFGL